MKQKNVVVGLSTVLFFTLGVSMVLAHQPNEVGTSTAIVDTEATISKAYYGELVGDPAIYTVVATSSFVLDVNILSPDKPGTRVDFTVMVVRADTQKTITILNDPPVAWPRWYEDFGGDWYRQGPEFKQQVPAGTYTVTVQNHDNNGQYVLAIGEDEVFPPSTALHTLGELYRVKTAYFGEPWYGIYRGVIGGYLLIASVVLLLILALLVWLIVRALRRRPRKS